MIESVWEGLRDGLPEICLIATLLVNIWVAKQKKRVEYLESENSRLNSEMENWQSMFDEAKQAALSAYRVIEGHQFLEEDLANRAGKTARAYRIEVRKSAGVKEHGFHFYSHSDLLKKKIGLTELSIHSIGSKESTQRKKNHE